ncbi:unnamed protein product, partial [Vitis vinifera]
MTYNSYRKLFNNFLYPMRLSVTTFTGYLSMQSSQGPFREGCTCRSASHTALNCRFFSSSSITALPPACMQKWLNASLKSARSIAMTPALHPIPPRLKLLILPLNLYLFTIMAEREGVGLNKLQFTTRMPMSLGLIQSLPRGQSAPRSCAGTRASTRTFDGRDNLERLGVRVPTSIVLFGLYLKIQDWTCQYGFGPRSCPCPIILIMNGNSPPLAVASLLYPPHSCAEGTRI